ncbi:MAG: HD domain-containing protein [Fimbriimonadaceae bacterium]|nr:HD domain-containing protein [Fimbriimonadaceae bacterium]QYK59498.1 MAG: HD domain-containing protein [Fimbriimonadaceae bacterium]
MNDVLTEALEFAIDRHRGQWREGDDPLPYVFHPVEVMLRLRQTGGVTDEAMLVAALLHDVVEETGTTLAEVQERFGESAAQLVAELTRREPSPSETEGLDKDALWRLRADMLIEDVAEMSPRAMMVKLCDRISNLEEAGRTRRGKKLVRYVWQSERFLETIPRTVHPVLWDELKATVKRVGE